MNSITRFFSRHSALKHPLVVGAVFVTAVLGVTVMLSRWAIPGNTGNNTPPPPCSAPPFAETCPQYSEGLRGDFNGDGRQDLVHLCCSDYANIWFGQADGSFVLGHLLQPGSGYAIQRGTWLVGDFNGDGRSDLIHLCCTDYANVWFGQPDGSFVPGQPLQPGPGYAVQAGFWKVADVNGDGRSDLIHFCCADYAEVWLGQADGSFVHTRLLQPGSGYAMQTGTWLVGDFNGDGRSDLIHLCCTDYANVWYGQPDGSFVAGHVLQPGSGYAVQDGTWRVGDFNGDGRSDLIHFCCADHANVWFGQLDGSFVAGHLLQSGSGYAMQAGTWRVGDFNGDGRSDLIHLCCADSANVWFGQPDGSFVLGHLLQPGSGYAVQDGSWRAGDFGPGSTRARAQTSTVTTTPTMTATGTPSATGTATNTATSTPTSIAIATATDTPTETPTETPTPTWTPRPTRTPTATRTG